MKLSTPDLLLMEKITIEEANEIRKKYSIRRFYFKNQEKNIKQDWKKKKAFFIT